MEKKASPVPLQLKADSRGIMVAERFIGRVSAVFERAVNITIPGDPMIVSLVTRRPAMSGRSVLVPWLPGALQAGDTVHSDSGAITITDRERRAEVDLTGAHVYRGRLPDVPWENDGVQRARFRELVVPQLRRSLDRVAVRNGLYGLLRTGARGGLPRISELDRFSTYAARQLYHSNPAGLVGLGSGLTPSGDDFLVGALAAEEFMKQRDETIDRRAIYLRAIEPDGTTDVGRTQIVLAIRGLFPEYLRAVFAALAESVPVSDNPGERVSNLEMAVSEAARHGHSSGSDALTGALWWLVRPS